MPILPKTSATIADLSRIEGKAELIHGEIARMSPTGGKPGRAGGFIFASLFAHERATKSGFAFPDNVGFRVSLPHRGSFSPDAAYVIGSEPSMNFVDGAPTFAAEVRSENDYGDEAERKIQAKIIDYFAAGTLVVWDVDLLSQDVVKVYRSTAPDQPMIYRCGDLADAEPAVPGWTMPVNDLFV